LTLTELAKLLQTNAPAISKVINQTGSNFNDFINEYRVREVQHKIEKHEHKAQTLLAIAFDSGFNSKATFNRAFKKIVGQTPKAYIEALS
jgi:AraC-like DNA-binding protein